MANNCKTNNLPTSNIINTPNGDVTALLEKETSSVGCSPAPSNCSLLSEQDPADGSCISRQSPIHSVSQASPSSSFATAFQRPDFLSTSVADSETSSRSSLDGSCLSKETTAEKLEKFKAQRSRKMSSDSSDSDGSELTVGGESVDGEEINSRKHSKTKAFDEAPIVAGAARPLDAPRGRIANIRRESNCSLDNEVAHERLLKASQQVSTGFDDITLEASTSAPDLRRRTPSVSSIGEPISIVTNVFMPHSCSPSPTRLPDIYKQCYSPSTQQIVRPNIPYSPSPSPTQSPTRHRLLRTPSEPAAVFRSLSPIATRTALKRRYTGSDETDGKRSCGAFVRNSTSPLVTDRTFPYPAIVQQEFAQPHLVTLSPSSSSSASDIRLTYSARRPFLFDSELARRTSVDSTSDDQKSTRDDLSEPSSVQMPLDESMEVDEELVKGSESESRLDSDSSGQSVVEDQETVLDTPLPEVTENF